MSKNAYTTCEVKPKTAHKNFAVNFSSADSINMTHDKVVRFLADIGNTTPTRVTFYTDEINYDAGTFVIAIEWINDGRQQYWFVANKSCFTVVWSDRAFLTMSREEYCNNWVKVF